MMNRGVWGALIVALAAYGCDTANGGPIGEGGSGGGGGSGGTGGMAGAGGMGGMAGAGGMGGMAGAGGMGGMAGAGGMGGMAGAGGMGGTAGAGGMGGMAGAGGMGGAGGMAIVESSCLDWRNGGADVNGTYQIVVGGSSLTVYCDMETDGGGWTQLYDQDVALGYLPADTWAAGVNTTPPDMGQYSILNLIDEFEGDSSGFEFFIDWPNDGADFVRWQQSQSPFDGQDASGIVQAPTDQMGCTAFGGLGVESRGRSALTGSTNNNCWWWAVGASKQYGGVGIPAYMGLVATRTRLWVR